MSRFQIFLSVAVVLIMSGMITLFISLARTNEALEQIQITNGSNARISSDNPDSINSTSSISTDEGSLKASISGLLSRIEKLEKNKDTASTPITQQVQTTSFQPQVIYLGSTTTTSGNWTDSGIEVSLNKSDYPSNTNVAFQAGLSVIGGEAWARLTNKTTGAIISISEVFHAGSTTTWKSSPEFELHSGSNIYVVELRSTSGEVANLSGARLIISK